jgi:hypothetical protein
MIEFNQTGQCSLLLLFCHLKIEFHPVALEKNRLEGRQTDQAQERWEMVVGPGNDGELWGWPGSAVLV